MRDVAVFAALRVALPRLAYAAPLISSQRRAVSARMDHDDLISITAAAALVGRTTRTLRGWADTGRLTVFRGPGGRRWFRRAEVEALRPQPEPQPQPQPEPQESTT